MKKRNESNRATPKSITSSAYKRFEDINQNEAARQSDRHIIRKSYALTKPDINHIQQIKDKCLNRRVVLNDSHIIRIALMLASKMNEEILIKASKEVPRLVAGRPRINK